MDSARELLVLGIVGSLRVGSLNRRLMAEAIGLAPAGMRIVAYRGLRSIPPYDADIEAAGLPPGVARLKDSITGADGLLFATPEYNAGIPGLLKNALDWASRPAYNSVLAGKPAALMGATPGRGGAQRALQQLSATLSSTRTDVHPGWLALPRAHERLDHESGLDDAGRRQLEELLAAFRAFIIARVPAAAPIPEPAGSRSAPSTAA